jgi:hypothetical protein
MKKSLCLALFLAACGGDDGGLTGDDAPPDANTPDTPPGSMVIHVKGDITGPITWEAKNTYILDEYTFLISGKLTIEAGTVIKGENGSALAITKDATLDAQGTVDKPIVFTSNKATPTPGDWGGLVMLGKAPINVVGGTNAVEGFPTSFGDRITYGGTNAAHDCGKLKYARIEYAGFLLSPDNELNGLTVGGCGSATLIDYVQVHLGQDDGVEMFGGNANLSHIVISQPDDDGLDWDRGWTGKVQFLVVQQKTGRGDKAIEADNNNNDNELLPRSAPEIWNMTLVGANGAVADPQGGIHVRRGTAGKINNAIVMGFTKFAVDVDGASSVAQVTATNLALKNVYFVKGTNAASNWPANFDGAGAGNDAGFDEAAVIGGDVTNKIDTDPQLGAAFNITTPNWKPNAGSPVLAGCGTPPAGFDTTATFCGAIGATDWTAGWTKF